MSEKEVVIIADRDHVEQRKEEITVPAGWKLIVKSYAEYGGEE